MRKWLASAVLLSVVAAVASAEVTVRLTDVPSQLRFPLADGQNAILTARIDGQTRSVWLATGRDAKARYLLDDVGDGVFQVNLADPVLSAMLEASGAGEVRVFAETRDGGIVQSVPVRYAVSPDRQEWTRPPRVFVHTAKEVTEVTGWGEGMDPYALAFMAQVHGQGIEFSAPELSRMAYGGVGRGITAWFDPAKVESVEVRFDADAHKTSARGIAGKQEWPCTPMEGDKAKVGLEVGEAAKKGWEEEGKLTIACKQEGMDDLQVVLKALPRKLDLPEGEGKLVVVQRYTEPIPGSDGYLRLHIDDITGGQTLLDLTTADGRELVKRKSVRDGETVRFTLGVNEYDLTMTKMVNLLIGDDYCEFVVKPHVEPAPAP